MTDGKTPVLLTIPHGMDDTEYPGTTLAHIPPAVTAKPFRYPWINAGAAGRTNILRR